MLKTLPENPLLVVEDDAHLRAALCESLEAEGYRVETADSCAEARDRLVNNTYALILLDIMLPDGDGCRLCEEFRQRDRSTPVIMLTARSLEDDLVRGFAAGADDYVNKPYRLGELFARIGAALRRAGCQPQTTELSLPGFTIDTAARRLLDAAGQEIETTKTEFDLLAFLVGNPNRALTRDEIIDQVWDPGVVIEPRTVDNFISSLKRKLRWGVDSDFAIHAIRGVGYRLEIVD